jgi:hypothetical protein
MSDFTVVESHEFERVEGGLAIDHMGPILRIANDCSNLLFIINEYIKSVWL